jgi:hypothetical protein
MPCAPAPPHPVTPDAVVAILRPFDGVEDDAALLAVWRALDATLLSGLADAWTPFASPANDAMAAISRLHVLERRLDPVDRVYVAIRVRRDVTEPSWRAVARSTLEATARPILTRLAWRWPLRTPVGPYAEAPWRPSDAV